jgi:hypothetical protein
MAVDDPSDDVGQVAVRFDGEQLAGFFSINEAMTA